MNDLSGVLIPLAVCVILGVGFGWRAWRRSNAKPGKKTRIDRVRTNARPTPNADPAKDAVSKDDAVLAFDSVNVRRPTMLAVTTAGGDIASAGLFIQRAFKIDREHWRELSVPAQGMNALEALFGQVAKLAWVPGSIFERHIYAVSFSPALDEAMKKNLNPFAETGETKLQFCAIDEKGMQLGESMSVSDSAQEHKAGICALWRALNPADGPHELEASLLRELEIFASRTKALAQYVAEQTQRTWELRAENVAALVRNIQQREVDLGKVEEQGAQVDQVIRQMHAEADRIDGLVLERTQNVKTIEDADTALLHAIAYMHVRELTVRVLRICGLMRVIRGGTFAEEMKSANRITANVAEFTDVKPLIAAAQAIAHDTLVNGTGKTMVDSEIERVGAIARHADRLTETHDELVKALESEALVVQNEIDRYLLQQSRARRHAVRVADDGRIEKMFVLD